jgi:hypothetical protein
MRPGEKRVSSAVDDGLGWTATTGTLLARPCQSNAIGRSALAALGTLFIEHDNDLLSPSLRLPGDRLDMDAAMTRRASGDGDDSWAGPVDSPPGRRGDALAAACRRVWQPAMYPAHHHIHLSSQVQVSQVGRARWVSRPHALVPCCRHPHQYLALVRSVSRLQSCGHMPSGQ